MDIDLSIVIPTYRAAGHLGQTLRALADRPAGSEIIVADARSDDETRDLAWWQGARVVDCPRGRGPQLAAGAGAARGEWLLFLHADTRPGAEWVDAVEAFRADPANRRRAGYFRLRLDDAGTAARRVERLANWRARTLGLPYGDQGLLLHRAFYDDCGGFRPMVLMEDVDLVRRIGRGRLVGLNSDAVTSAARYRRGGWRLRPARNLFCLALYFLGVPPRWIAPIYR